jgi:hypothetical protein
MAPRKETTLNNQNLRIDEIATVWGRFVVSQVEQPAQEDEEEFLPRDGSARRAQVTSMSRGRKTHVDV